MASQSKTDLISVDLTTQGFNTGGSLASREYARLRVKTGATKGSLADLYKLAGEPNRLVGKK